MNHSLQSFFVLLGPLADLLCEVFQPLLLVVTQPFLAFELVELCDSSVFGLIGPLLDLLDLTGKSLLLLLVELRRLLTNGVEDIGRARSIAKKGEKGGQASRND